MGDDEIIARAKSGDPDAWRTLYQLHAGRLSALMRLVHTGDFAVANEDLAAHAWLTAADKIASFAGDSDAFGGWLYSIARNQGSHARRRASHVATPVSVGGSIDLASGYSSWTDIAEHAGAEVEHLSWVRDVLGRLPERQREVVACIDVVGLGIEATAQALGITASAVRVNHHRGLARLRKILQAERTA